MQTDIHYSVIYVCPKTDDSVTYSSMMNSHGVCCICGHDSNSTITHANKIVGKWQTPSFYECVFQGKTSKFIRNK